MGVLDNLLPEFLRKPAPIADAAELAGFMDSRAAFLAQKCIVEFCRVRAGVYWQKLFSEKDFQEALDHARWRAYPACYAMVAEMVEGALREAAGLRQRGLPAALEKLALASFSKYPCPRVRLQASGTTPPNSPASASPPPRLVRRGRCASFPIRWRERSSRWCRFTRSC